MDLRGLLLKYGKEGEGRGEEGGERKGTSVREGKGIVAKGRDEKQERGAPMSRNPGYAHANELSSGYGDS